MSAEPQPQASVIRPADAETIREAAAIIVRGGLVAFPTETVYGLGADATNPTAVAKIFAVKGRPHFDPLIVHVASVAEAEALWRVCPEPARRLMRAFWPGPLTLVLPKTPRIPDLVTAGLPTVAVRMPDHAVARQLIRATGHSLAAPSANRFGRPSPTTAQAVAEELGEAVSCILDDGPTRVGIESTVLAFENGAPVLLRPGGVPVETIQQHVGVVRIPTGQPVRPSSPGMLARHYAPRTPLYLLEPTAAMAQVVEALRNQSTRIGVLALQPVPGANEEWPIEILSRTGDLIEAAAGFFQAIRRLDAQALEAIVASPIPEQGLGCAMTDRLRRASTGTAVIHQGILVLRDRAA